MGGRGASSGGRSGRAPSGYRRVGKVYGVVVLRSSDTRVKILPTAASPNSQYLGMNKHGKIKQLRSYDNNGRVKQDIDCGHSFDGRSERTVHSHKWKNGERDKTHRPLTKSEILKYKEVIEKATGRKDLIWEW